MPASLLIQRPRHATCRGVRDACQVYQGRLREFPQVSRRLPRRSREFPQVSRHLPWRLRESRKSLGIYRGVCGSSRKSLGIYRGVCGSPASLSAFAVAFAQAAQVSRHLPRRLRKRRKSLGVCRGVCAGGAGSLGICRGVCASGASLSAFAAAFAQAARGLSAFARPGFLTAPPRAGRWGVCWASSRRPTRGERRRRRGLHSARSAGC